MGVRVPFGACGSGPGVRSGEMIFVFSSSASGEGTVVCWIRREKLSYSELSAALIVPLQ
jgi:hypothetical protein